jgi:hypothetical protein
MPFEAGQSGNPGGRSKRAKLVADALIIELKSRDNKSTEAEPQGIRKIVAKLVDLAEGGDMKAIEFVRDTTDGKPAQAIVGDEDEPPINLVSKIVREIVRPQPNNSNG